MQNIKYIQPGKISLLWMIVVTIVIAFLLVTVAFAIFLNSDAYDTVKQISAADHALHNDLDGMDTSSPIQATDLDNFSQALRQRIKMFNDAEDFGQINL